MALDVSRHLGHMLLPRAGVLQLARVAILLPMDGVVPLHGGDIEDPSDDGDGGEGLKAHGQHHVHTQVEAEEQVDQPEHHQQHDQGQVGDAQADDVGEDSSQGQGLGIIGTFPGSIS